MEDPDLFNQWHDQLERTAEWEKNLRQEFVHSIGCDCDEEEEEDD